MQKVKFNVKELRNAASSSSACMDVVNFNKIVGIHPCYLNDVETGVMKDLNSMLNKYYHQYGGIVIGYTNVKTLSPYGEIRPKTCFIFYPTDGQLFIFKPEIGSILEGTVVKKTARHVACLIHNIFNVSCPAPERIAGIDWIGSKVKENDRLTLQIEHINMQCTIPFIRASIEAILPPIKLENGHQLDLDVKTNGKNEKFAEDTETGNSPQKKKKKDQFEVKTEPPETSIDAKFSSRKKKKEQMSQAEAEKTPSDIEIRSPSQKETKRNKFSVKAEVEESPLDVDIQIPPRKKRKRENHLEVKLERTVIDNKSVSQKKNENIQVTLEIDNLVDTETQSPPRKKRKKEKLQIKVEQEPNPAEIEIECSPRKKKKKDKTDQKIKKEVI